MARSNIIKDFVSKQASLDTTLKRLKVILYSLDYQHAIDWLEKELNGYDKFEDLPNYRILEGLLYGDYIKGTALSHLKATKQIIPINKLSEELQNAILTVPIYNDIETLQKFVDTENPIGKPLTAEISSHISQAYNFLLSNANVKVDSSQIMSIIKHVENKTLDVLLKLEKEFGNLDELDVDLNKFDTEKINVVNQNITAIIYDKSITIGNNNSIKSSDFNS